VNEKEPARSASLPSEPAPRNGGPGFFALRREPPALIGKLLGLGSVALVLLLWFILTMGGAAHERIMSPVILPSPGEVADSISALFGERGLVRSIAATLIRLFEGFGLAILIAVPAGIVAGAYRVFNAFVAPLALFGRNVPIAALIPLTVMWFGIGESQKVFFIFLATAPFIFSDTAKAIVSIPERYVETAQTLGASRWQVITKVLVPLALPDIYTGLRNLFGLAFGYIMLAELINAEHGLGHLLSVSQKRGLTEHIFLILIIIGILAYLIDRGLLLFQRGLFPHRQDLK
jgi:ABC-type nitrate/sulfonate/bicarbonate transport system permease component